MCGASAFPTDVTTFRLALCDASRTLLALDRVTQWL